MAYEVVRPFAYSANGIHGVSLCVGDVREDFGASTDGLLAEGWINLREPATLAGALVEFAVASDADHLEMAIEKPRRGRSRK